MLTFKCLSRFSIVLLLIEIISGNIQAQSLKATNLLKNQPAPRFLENKGQVVDQNGQRRPDVKYIYDNHGFKLILKENGFSYELYTIEKQPKISEATGQPMDAHLPDKFKEPDPVTIKTSRVDVTLKGANPHPEIITEGRSTDYVNYYKEYTPENGITGIHYYDKVTYRNIYQNIDFVFYARKDGSIKYDIVVRPGGKLSDVKMAYKGGKGVQVGSNTLKLDGNLGYVAESIPSSYIQGNHQAVAVTHKVYGDHIIGFATTDHTREALVIDPLIGWSTFFGGVQGDYGEAVTLDDKGNVCMVGYTNSSSGIATTGAYQTSYTAGNDNFVVKFNKSGTIQWATYHGGNSTDEGHAIAADSSGNIYIAGETTSSSGISTSGAYQTSYGGSNDAFIAKFSSSGTMAWATYLGGSLGDEAYAVALDSDSGVYITGGTNSYGIATTGAYQTSISGGGAFIAKFNASGSRQWTTYYGANGTYGSGITINHKGHIYIVGWTSSTSGIASTGAHQTIYGGGNADAFIAKFNISGSNRLWATYYGGKREDYGYDIAADDSDYLYFTGYTVSTSGIATDSSYQSSFAGNGDALLVKFNNDGKRVWGTYYGGNAVTSANGIAIAMGDIYITGYTTATTGMATTSGVFQAKYGGGKQDAYIARFSSIGMRKWGSYYGGENFDYANDIAVDDIGNMGITGYTVSSQGIASSGAYQNSYKGSMDAFVLKDYVPTINAAIGKELKSPVNNTCEGENEVKINFINNDTVAITKMYFGWEVNGKLQPEYHWSGSVLGGDTSNTITIGRSLLNKGDNTFKIWLTGANEGVLRTPAYDTVFIKVKATESCMHIPKELRTYFGGTGNDYATSMGADKKGNIYIAGHTTTESGLATTGVEQDTFSNLPGGYRDAFIAKFKPSGARAWATYYGAKGDDYITDVAVDDTGNIYVVGNTNGFGLATQGAYQFFFGGDNDVFIAKFDSNGSRLWATYYGSSGYDFSGSIALDKKGNVYIIGTTNSTKGIATPGAYQSTITGNFDAFIVKFDNGGKRQWATYYGGASGADGFDIAIGDSGNVYIVGSTDSSFGIASSGAYQTSFGGVLDVFVAKFSSDGQRKWSTYYGGPSYDVGYCIASNEKGDVYIAGNTMSKSGISSPGAYKDSFGGSYDVFIAKFDSQGGRQWATYYGASAADEAQNIALDSIGNVYISGHTASVSSIASFGSYHTSFQGGTYDAFTAKFNKDGSRLWGTYYGGEDADIGTTIITDHQGNTYLSGYSSSTTGIAATEAFQVYNAGGYDAFLAKLPPPRGDAGVVSLASPAYGDCSGISDATVRIRNFSASDSLECAYIHWAVNGVTQPPHLWSGILGPNDTSSVIAIGKGIFSAGTNTIKIWTTEPNGGKDTVHQNDTLTLIITMDAKPAAAFSAANVCYKNAVSFTNKSTIANGSMSYLWKFGDGKSDTVVNPSHMYEFPGAYTAWLKVTSDEGCKDSISDTVVIYPMPQAAFSYVAACRSIAFKDSSSIDSGNMIFRHWNFGDGDTSTASAPVHTYNKAGTYTAWLKVTSNSGCVDSTSRSITIYPTPQANFSFRTQCRRASFADSSSIGSGSIVSRHWNFGDGDTSSDAAPVHFYSNGGTYTVWLKVVSSFGCTDSVSKEVTILMPKAGFKAYNSCLWDTIHFSNTSTSVAGDTLSYVWNFGDSGTSTEANPYHLYASPGNYQVSLYVSSQMSSCHPVYSDSVTVYPIPSPSYSIVPACTGDSTFFFNTSTISSGKIVGYTWNFGDGSSSLTMNARHVYKDSGAYTVWLKTVSDHGCTDSVSKKIKIYEKPVAGFRYNVSGNTVMFKPYLRRHDWEYVWYFGDGDSASVNQDSVTHFYGGKGTYHVKLHVLTPQGCESNASDTVHIDNSGIPPHWQDLRLSLYPNPFQDQFTINYTLPSAEQIQMSLIDITGKEILITQPTLQAAGPHTADISTTDYQLSGNVYTVRIIVGEQVYYRQLVRLK